MKQGAAQDRDSSPWELFEQGKIPWNAFSHKEQEAIVRHYAPKIRFLALRLKTKVPPSVQLNELFSAGSLGLLEALVKYRPSKENRFETFAENRIKGAMLDELRNRDWYPRPLRQRVRLLEETIHAFEMAQGRKPNEQELLKSTQLSVAEIREGLEALENQTWLTLDDLEGCMADGHISSDSSIFEQIARKELIDKLIPLIDKLEEREKLILSLYYTEGMSMRECAAILGLSEGRVSQLHSLALKQLRHDFFHAKAL
ncbi:MAG: FliA/WhiG family RNA polymerase sigma factor [Desulfovibrio sp.]|nr:FliA/WhiG family RNA polymerase sigma factor [Desulfovibrio sp.]